jgi:nucleotide-binding universal stress UspA family protein
MKNRIIVGYDGSTSSAAAAEWAAGEAALRGVPLCIVTCYAPPFGVGLVPSAGAAVAYDMAQLEQASVASGEALAESLRTNHAGLVSPGLVTEVKAVLGPPREVLVDASADADLVVVGKTGAGAAKAMFLGSVANSVVRRSTCPTVLVPAAHSPSSHSPVSRRRIAVGVDGSAPSMEALEWAMEEAALGGGELVLVHAWSYRYDVPATDAADASEDARRRAQAELDSMLESVRARAAGFTVRGHLVEDAPAAALLDEGDEADLLVVGSRGRGGLRAMLFGSVAHAVTEHATCPTVVLRHHHDQHG